MQVHRALGFWEGHFFECGGEGSAFEEQDQPQN
jgi:hypothetical protein